MTALGDPLPLQIKATDGNVALFPRATVFDGVGAPVAVRDLTHLGQGLYRDLTFTPTAVGVFAASYQVFADAGHTTLADYEQASDLFAVELRDEEPMLAANYNESLDELRLATWLLRAGTQALDVSSVAISIQAADDLVVLTPTDLAPDTQKVFRLTVAAPGLVAGTVYTATVTMTLVSGRVVRGQKAFKAVT